MKKYGKKIVACLLSLALIMAGMGIPNQAEAAKKVRLNKTSVVLKKGKRVRLKVKNTKKKVRWSSTNKKVAIVTQKGLVRAKRKGNAVIIARVGGKKYRCKVTVKVNTKNSTQNPTESASPDLNVTTQPDESTTPSASAQPDESASPSASAQPDESASPSASAQPDESASPSASAQPGESASPSASAQPDESTSPSPSASPEPSESPGVELSGDALTAGSFSAKIGMTETEVKNVLGSPSRQDISPMGFTVYVYKKANYANYMLISFSDGVVVSISGMAPKLSYGTALASGTTASTLSADTSWNQDNSWNIATNVSGTIKETAVYSKAVDNVRIVAYTDYFGSKKVFCLQAFSSQYSYNDMTNPGKTGLALSYTDAVLEDMEAEVYEMLCVYRKLHSMDTLERITGLDTVAQGVSDKMKQTKTTAALNRSADTVLYEMIDNGVDPSHWAEDTAYGSIDSVGFATFFILFEEAQGDIVKNDGTQKYAAIGLGASYVKDGSTHKTYLVLDFCSDDWDEVW